MKFINMIVVSAVAVLAVPTSDLEPRVADRQVYEACDGLTEDTQCCGSTILGLIGLDCISPPSTFTSAAGFTATCSAVGAKPRCCLLGDVLDLGLLCFKPNGINI